MNHELTLEQVQKILDDYEKEMKKMMREARNERHWYEPRHDDAQLRGTLLTERGDDPIWLGWTDPSDCDVEELMDDINEYIRDTVAEFPDEFSIGLESPMYAKIPWDSRYPFNVEDLEECPLDHWVCVDVMEYVKEPAS